MFARFGIYLYLCSRKCERALVCHCLFRQNERFPRGYLEASAMSLAVTPRIVLQSSHGHDRQESALMVPLAGQLFPHVPSDESQGRVREAPARDLCAHDAQEDRFRHASEARHQQPHLRPVHLSDPQ